MSEKRKRAEDLPPEVIEAFRTNDVSFDLRSIHTWEEHCTECAFPECYKTCDLFVPRKDGNCRRFEDGVVRISDLVSGGGPVVEVTFKRWANMFSVGSSSLVPSNVATRAELNSRRLSEFLGAAPDGNITVQGWPAPIARIAKRVREQRRSKLTQKISVSPSPESFSLVIYVPSSDGFDVTLSIALPDSEEQRPYQKRLILAQGYHQVDIPMAEITDVIGDTDKHYISLIPNTEGNSTNKVYLGFMGFTCGAAATAKAAANSVKVMVWDLDHTLWDGVLVEDGIENITLKAGIVDVIKTLDSRGIVNSIASKNDPEPTLAALKTLGLDELFVFPKISWRPKSRALREIVRDMNVGANTVAFIDDQLFERAEVEASIPEVRIYDASQYRDILALPDFNPELSSESASRRQFYINENSRRKAVTSYDSSDYEAFLKDCHLQMTILRGAEQNIDRIYELTQRTNQMNFSGTRYKRKDIIELLGDEEFDVYTLKCRDRFGDYGTVGFGLVQFADVPGKNPRIVDLAFSCRVQAKRTEHAFLTWLANTYRDEGASRLEIKYVPTARNAATAAVFDDLEFEIDAVESTPASKILSVCLSTPTAQTYPWVIEYQDRRSLTHNRRC